MAEAVWHVFSKFVYLNPIYMKNFYKTAFAFMLLVTVGFTSAYSLEAVMNALKKGNVTQLSRHFDTRIDVSLPDKSDNYSKKQAELILRDFFSSNPVKNFVVKHKGEMNGSQYCIGSLLTQNGNFRTKLYMKKKDGIEVLQEIAFQSED